jgi:hypothetical protein
MPVLITSDVPGQTPEGYDAAIEQLEAALTSAPGFIAVGAYPSPDGWRVFELWQSSKEAADFFAKHVRPNLPADIQPKRTTRELHSLVTV